MADFGLTTTGFVPKTTNDARAEIVGSIQTAFGSSFDCGDGSAAGELAGIVAAAVGELWEVTEQVNSSTDRDAAVGTSLDSIGALMGTLRLAATSSIATLTLTGDPGITIDPGFRALTASTAAEFVTSVSSDNVTLALDAWVLSTSYVIGDRVTNAARAYICTVAGTSASSGGPTSQALSIADGPDTLIWAWIGEGTASLDIASAAVETGPVVATARDLILIKTPVGGIQNVTNLIDALPGTNVETDPDYRTRQLEDLEGGGAATAAAIRAQLLRLDGVTAAHVFMNLTDTIDVDGVPPHAVEALVQGGDGQAIVDLLGEEIVTGIATVGTSSGSHTDSEGTTFTVSYSRPAEILIYLRITLVKSATTYAGDTVAEDVVSAYGADVQVIGKDAVPSSIAASVLPVRVQGAQVAGVTGVIKVTDCLAYNDVIGVPVAWVTLTVYSATPGARSVVTNGGRSYICITSGTSGATGPTSTSTDITDGTAHWYFLGSDIAISQRQIARLDTSRTTIVSSDGTP